MMDRLNDVAYIPPVAESHVTPSKKRPTRKILEIHLVIIVVERKSRKQGDEEWTGKNEECFRDALVEAGSVFMILNLSKAECETIQNRGAKQSIVHSRRRAI
jgi:hypothetical protein